MAHCPLKNSTQINMKQRIGFLLYQCDGCICFCAISSAMFGSVLDNATFISWIVSNRIQGCGRCIAVPRKLSCGPQKDRGPQFENHCCNLLSLHESMLQINHCKSAIWSGTCAKMWIAFNVQDTLKYGWKSYSFFTPLPGWKKLVFFIIACLWAKIIKIFQCENLLWHGGYLLTKDQ